ncbi:GNAT family protein [Micromonospora sp. NPDC047187]|uniref:GNAT family N-acetyltransferase n=1 Tax=Micromonospora sp. NPDC047187 TaxID=3155262 RepID=UPI0033EE8961
MGRRPAVHLRGPRGAGRRHPAGGQRGAQGVTSKRPAPEVGYWTASWARGRGVAPRAVLALSRWAFDRFPEVARLDLLHQVDNVASCRVAQKCGFVFQEVLPARPPFPLDGHRHSLHAG